MIPPDTLSSILGSAVQAPSGENAQPWRFEVEGDRISLFNIPENDRSLYNFRQRASYISHGAVIENIVIAASHFGLDTSIVIAPESNPENLVAAISLADASNKKEDPLYESISKRSTNRKTYKGGVIPASTMDVLANAAKAIDEVSLKFATEPEIIQQLATIASVNDRLLLENRSLHDFFFSHVHWSLAEEESKRSGFYIKVLELVPPADVLFRLFKYWPIMSVFNMLGAAKMGAKENSKIYASASAIGTITVLNEDAEAFINAGRALQKIWLTATANGLSVQPLTGVLFFHQRIQGGEAKAFSASQIAAAEGAYEGTASLFGASQGIVTMMFRIGYADAPTATSLKKLPNVTVK